MSDEQPPADGADPWCEWCGADLGANDDVWQIDGHDDGRWPPAFCSRDCASDWGNAATQGDEYQAEPSVLAHVDDERGEQQ